MAALSPGGVYAGTPSVSWRKSVLCGPDDAGEEVVVSAVILSGWYM